MLDDYSELTAMRRGTRLIKDSSGPNFSILNAIVIILIIAMVIAGFASLI